MKQLRLISDELLRKVPLVGPIYHRIHRAVPRPALTRRLKQRPPAFVYQVGKVASTSIYDSLLDQYPGEVLHSHTFGTPKDEAAVHAFYRMHAREPLPVKIISPIRDPVSRNVSAFFQNFKRTTGYKFRDYPGTVDDLLKIFLERAYHLPPLIWFDQNLLPNFGIDVYAVPFSKKGVQRYQNGLTEALVLKHDLPDPVKETAIREFLGCDDFVLRNSNVSSQKRYASTYANFKQKKLPATYVDEMLNSKFARHFYGDQLLDIRRRWTQDVPSNE